MKTLTLDKLFTKDQWAAVIELHEAGATAGHYKQFIESQEDVIKKCQEHEVHPPYLAYYLEYLFSKQ